MNFDFNIVEKLLWIPGILVGLSFHEYAHAQVAVWLGDDTPKNQGRVTVSPAAHVDIMGFIMLFVAGFGWGKPVYIDERNFKHPRRDDILVSLAGPAMNLLVAICFFIFMKILGSMPSNFISVSLYHTIMNVFYYTAVINIVLCVFNLLPIPPLDGSHIFFGLFGLKDKPFYYEFYTKGRFILLLLIVTNAIDKIINTPVSFIYVFLRNLFL